MTDFLGLRKELESHVRTRTGRRIRGLDIQLSPECVKLNGQTSEYLRQTACPAGCAGIAA